MENKRFDSSKELQDYLKKEFNIVSFAKIDKSGLVSDYAFLAGINEDWGYVDIYYCKGYNGFIITEVSVSAE